MLRAWWYMSPGSVNLLHLKSAESIHYKHIYAPAYKYTRSVCAVLVKRKPSGRSAEAHLKFHAAEYWEMQLVSDEKIHALKKVALDPVSTDAVVAILGNYIAMVICRRHLSREQSRLLLAQRLTL
jgi:hypothetical protein